MSSRTGAAWLVALGVLGGSGCCKESGWTPSAFRSFTPGETVSVEVPGDSPVLVVHGPAGERGAIVYLHGRCADPRPDAAALAATASQRATLIVPLADQACQGSPNRHWTQDREAIQRRIDRALEAASAARGAALDRDKLTLVGCSEGAARAEALASLHPDRYPRVALIGAPDAPSAHELSGARAVALLAGERDRHDLMLVGEQSLRRAGKPVKFWVLPGAEHGEFGPQGNRVMGEALAWLFAESR